MFLGQLCVRYGEKAPFDFLFATRITKSRNDGSIRWAALLSGTTECPGVGIKQNEEEDCARNQSHGAPVRNVGNIKPPPVAERFRPAMEFRSTHSACGAEPVRWDLRRRWRVRSLRLRCRILAALRSAGRLRRAAR